MENKIKELEQLYESIFAQRISGSLKLLENCERVIEIFRSIDHQNYFQLTTEISQFIKRTDELRNSANSWSKKVNPNKNTINDFFEIHRRLVDYLGRAIGIIRKGSSS